MAKKKRKPVNHKQSQHTHLSKMSSTEVFAAQAKECFKEQIRNAKENENIDNSSQITHKESHQDCANGSLFYQFIFAVNYMAEN